MPTLLLERKKSPLAVQPSMSTPPASPKAPRKSPARAAVSETPSNTDQWQSWPDGFPKTGFHCKQDLPMVYALVDGFYFLFSLEEIQRNK